MVEATLDTFDGFELSQSEDGFSVTDEEKSLLGGLFLTVSVRMTMQCRKT